MKVLDVIEDLVRAYFDKLFLGAILIGLILVALRSTDPVSTWATNQAGTIVGAIVMLTTGKIIDSYRTKNGNGNGHSSTEAK